MPGFDPISFGAGAGLNLLGGYLNNEAASDRQDQNNALQREFAQNGIRWRVEDAKAAGVHPVFALGGSGASFSPGPINVGGGVGDAMMSIGQDLTRSARAGSTRTENHWNDAIQAATLERIESETRRNDAEAMAIYSRAARNGQQATPGLPDNAVSILDSGGGNVDRSAFFTGLRNPLSTDAVNVEASRQPSASSLYPSREAGVRPFLQEHRYDDRGSTLLLPSQELGEILESAPWPVRWSIWAQVASANWNHIVGRQERQVPRGSDLHPLESPEVKRMTFMDAMRRIFGLSGAPAAPARLK